jgi:anti-anti-sigma regulatory factor
MTWKIDRLAESRLVVLRLSGQIDRDDVATLREAIGREKGPVAIDLTEIMLVDREAVRLFATSELNGIELRNCPAYIREWVTQEREPRE